MGFKGNDEFPFLQYRGDVSPLKDFDAGVVEIDGDVGENRPAHFSPSVAKHPVLGQIVPLLDPAVEQRESEVILGPRQKVDVIDILGLREGLGHYLDDIPLNHHEPGGQVLNFRQVVVDLKHTGSVVDVVAHHVGLQVIFRRHGLFELGLLSSLKNGFHTSGLQKLVPLVVFDGVDAADDGLVGDQEFKDIIRAPSDVGVDEHEMGGGLDVHGLGDQVVAGA